MRWVVALGAVTAFGLWVAARPSADALAPDAQLKVGVSLAVSGPDLRWGVPMLYGVELAVEDVNRAGGAGGHVLEPIVVDVGALGEDTLTHQQAVAAAYQRLVDDPAVVAAIGPQTSGEARAVAALLSRANLASITPSATTFDVTDPTLAHRFRPGGQAVLFRTVGTDLVQGEAMAQFAHQRLGVRRIALIDDSSEFAARVLDAFERHAGAAGITVVKRWHLISSDADYRPELREMAGLRPDAVFLGARLEVGIRLARQIAEIRTSALILGTETFYNRAFPAQAGSAVAEGWRVTNVGPDPEQTPTSRAWAERYRQRFGAEPTPYSMTAYAAAVVVADAVSRVVKHGVHVTRATVRDAIASTRLADTPVGLVSFDPDGDLEHPAVSIYQIKDGRFHHVETIFPTGIKIAVETPS
jgi:branched-chain amino acid transport system substrate-binding protein